jgi:hypothetical protein
MLRIEVKALEEHTLDKIAPTSRHLKHILYQPLSAFSLVVAYAALLLWTGDLHPAYIPPLMYDATNKATSLKVSALHPLEYLLSVNVIEALTGRRTQLARWHNPTRRCSHFNHIRPSPVIRRRAYLQVRLRMTHHHESTRQSIFGHWCFRACTNSLIFTRY